MNKAIIIGNLTGNPESRVVSAGGRQAAVCSFTVAVNRSVKGKKITDYFRVSCWDNKAENAMKYLAKGSKVYVSGPVSAHAYTARNGAAQASLEIFAEEIEYLSSRQAAGAPPAPEMPPPAPDGGFMHIPDDIDKEIPFA